MSELIDCRNDLTVEMILRAIAKKDNGNIFLGVQGLGGCPVGAEYQAVYDAMTNKPSDADCLIQETMLQALVDGGYYAKAEFLDVLSTHTNAGGEAQINWRSPGTFDPTLVNNPVFTNYAGFTGNVAATRYVRSNFTPSVDGTIIGQNNICAIIGVGTDLAQDKYDFGGSTLAAGLLRITSRWSDNNAYYGCNDNTANPVANLNGMKYYAVSRTIAANYDSYINLVRTNIIKVSGILCDGELHICGINLLGVPTPCDRQIRFAFLFSYLTEAEVQGVIGIMNTYLTNYGTNLY